MDVDPGPGKRGGRRMADPSPTGELGLGERELLHEGSAPPNWSRQAGARPQLSGGRRYMGMRWSSDQLDA